MSKISGRYLASDLIKADLKGSKPLIESVLYERDNTILLGKEKAGKSIFSMQMACALSVGGKFLDQFEVPNPMDVVYLQAEGKLANTQENLINMTKFVKADLNRILWLYYPSIPLDTGDGYKEIAKQIHEWRRPGVIFIDPLYMAMAGDLKDDVASRLMINNLRNLSEFFESTIVLVHHAHKTMRHNGSVINEGDDAIFGSFVWKAYPDQILMLEKVQGNKFHRRLSCSTQRMGNVIDDVDLTFMEPSPLYFMLNDGKTKPIDELVYSNVGHATTIKELETIVDRSRQHILYALHRLEKNGRVKRTGLNPSIYQKVVSSI